MLSDKIEQVALKGQKPSMAWVAWVGTEVAALEAQLEESKTRSNNYWADLLHSKAQLAALREATDYLTAFPRWQWDWLLDYLPDDDCPQYDALRACLDRLDA